MHGVLEPPATLRISQAEGEVTIDSGEAGVLWLRPDGRKTKREGGRLEVAARWVRNELVVESRRSDGPRLITSYMAVPDKRQLHVTTLLEGRGEPLTVRRVYDAAPAAEASPRP